jgi:hypothetical protein
MMVAAVEEGTSRNPTADPSTHHPSDEDLSLGTPTPFAAFRSPRMTQIGLGLCFPTHVAIRLRHGWGTLFVLIDAFLKCAALQCYR